MGGREGGREDCRQQHGLLNPPADSSAILLLQGEALQLELGRHIPLIGFVGQLVSGTVTPPDISGPFVGKRITTFSQWVPAGKWTRDSPDSSVTDVGQDTRPAKRIVLYRIPDAWREDDNLAETCLLQEDQWRTVPKAVNKALKSLSHGWPRHADVYPTLGGKERKTKAPKTKGPKKTKKRMPPINEESPDDDGQHDDATPDQQEVNPAVTPDLQDQDEEQLEEDDLDVDQIGDSDEEIPDENWQPTPEQKRDLDFAHDNSGHPTTADFARLLRRGNVDPKVVRWVKKNYKCETCEAHKRPSSRRPVAVPKTYRVNHVVGLDLVYVKES